MTSAVQPYALTRECRRTILLAVGEDGRVCVRAPSRMPKAEIDRFVLSKAAWIEKRRSRLAERPGYRFQSGERFPLSGRQFTLRQDENARYARLDGDTLTVPAEDAEKTCARLTGWYKKQAKSLFSLRLTALSAATGLPAAGLRQDALRLSSAKTRWGSCGAGGTINLNWRLVLAPPEILDYVMIHELCHLAQRNHSKAFWALVARYCPEWKARRKWLAEHGASLTLS